MNIYHLQSFIHRHALLQQKRGHNKCLRCPKVNGIKDRLLTVEVSGLDTLEDPPACLRGSPGFGPSNGMAVSAYKLPPPLAVV